MKKLNILFEDKNILVVNKPSGLPTIKAKNANNNLYSEVYDYLHKKNQKVFIVHRLDRDTSGLVLFAKNEKVKNILQDNWDKVIRKYICVTHGIVKDKIIKTKIFEDKTLKSHISFDRGLDAITIVKCIKTNNINSLCEIEIKTGRKNQIRCHMSYNNTPILGDKKYGIKDNVKHLMLLANFLEFTHPITKQKITIKLDIPKEFNI